LDEGNNFDHKNNSSFGRLSCVPFGQVKLFLPVRGKNLMKIWMILLLIKNKELIQEIWNKYKRGDINQLKYIKCLGLKYQAIDYFKNY
jgi:hypothetical protein